MLKLEEIKTHAAVAGIDPNAPVRIVTTEAVGSDALTVYYKTVDGAVLERMLFRAGSSMCCERTLIDCDQNSLEGH